MQRLFGFICALALLSAPLAVSAQVGKKGDSAEPLKLALIPEHLQRRIPGHQHKKTAGDEELKLEYGTPAPTPESENRGRRIGIGVGVALGLLAISLGVAGAAMASSVRSGGFVSASGAEIVF